MLTRRAFSLLPTYPGFYRQEPEQSNLVLEAKDLFLVAYGSLNSWVQKKRQARSGQENTR